MPLILLSSSHLLSHGSHCGGQVYVHRDGEPWWSVVVAPAIPSHGGHYNSQL